MTKEMVAPRFQEVIEVIEELPPDDQALLIEIIRRRLIPHRRAEGAAVGKLDHLIC
jgi:hypothetical protein